MDSSAGLWLHRMKVKHSTLILILLVLVFLADGANSILLNMGRDFFKVSIFFRFVVEAYLLLLLLRSRSGRWVWGLILFFFAVWSFGTLAASSNPQLYSQGEYAYFESFKFVNKMLFFFICWAAFKAVFRSDEERSRLFKVFEWLVIIQSVVIIASFLFHIELFAGYSSIQDGVINRIRFGYRGLIPAENEISAFFLIAFFYFLNKVVRHRKGVVQLILITVAGLLTGTKVSLVLVAVLGFYSIKWLFRVRIRREHLLLLGSVVLLVVVGVLNLDTLVSRLEPTIQYFTYWVGQKGPLLLFTTGRDIRLNFVLEEFLPYYNGLNILFGGTDLVKFATEMDVIDVFLKLGFVGWIAFYFSYIYVLLFSGKGINFDRLLFVAVWLGVSATAGHLVFSAINGGYLAILVLAFSVGFQRTGETATAPVHGLHSPILPVLKNEGL